MSILAGHEAEAHRCMRDLDVAGYRKLWRHIAPHLPQPVDDKQAEAMLHHARTQSSKLPLKLRAYSHRYLLDQGLPSGLPDHMKPKAERLYPVIREMVGVSINYTAPFLKPAADEVRSALEVEVLDAFAGSKPVDPFKLRAHLLDIKDREARRLIGRTIPTY